MKAAVSFPGIGYHVDKPLLYYSRKIAAACGYTLIDVPYGGFERGIKGDADKMTEAYQSALAQSRQLLKSVDFDRYETILFLSKSIGTAVAASFAAERGLHTYNVYYTPVPESFQVMRDPGIIFHGTADPWFPHEEFMRLCQTTDYPYEVIEGANHSLETGDVEMDLVNLENIMKVTRSYIEQLPV